MSKGKVGSLGLVLALFALVACAERHRLGGRYDGDGEAGAPEPGSAGASAGHDPGVGGTGTGGAGSPSGGRPGTAGTAGASGAAGHPDQGFVLF
jgi:hypothetical protein